MRSQDTGNNVVPFWVSAVGMGGVVLYALVMLLQLPH